jgi:hypothetical protein
MVPCLLVAAWGCGSDPDPPSPGRVAATTEREILRRIERETGVEGEDASADCDPDFRVEEGAAFACVVGVDGQEVDYDVEVEEVHGDGRVDVHFDNVQAVLIVERLLDSLVEEGLPEAATDTVDCEGQDMVLVRVVGATFTCTGVLLADGQGLGTVVYTVEDDSGRVTFSVRRGGATDGPRRPPSPRRRSAPSPPRADA